MSVVVLALILSGIVVAHSAPTETRSGKKELIPISIVMPGMEFPRDFDGEHLLHVSGSKYFLLSHDDLTQTDQDA
ncbi:hypothetical protein N7533_006223 [Penicillium manginii]|uniref:uncharacterized protein n=1 Tax=Penicillium manginii TaxID=203109 RepID=UPI0025496978|nr:uncharacterized protein N7533_006223 [Penicillium manginii]KAJ5756680.1 hypothetical protein N7533_006223 [Penicillium manginii]